MQSMVTGSAERDFVESDPDSTIAIPSDEHGEASCHVIDAASIEAVNAAIAIGRPLLLEGEPGTGKSQLARAVAAHLGWRFRSCVVDATTETHDLLWRLDAVQRLAEAQLLGSLRGGAAGNAADDEERARARLDRARFIEPGLLWWAFDWHDAERQCAKFERRPPVEVPPEARARPRCVVLIDELDKADSVVPNAMLEALGNGWFDVPAVGKVAMDHARPPLVIITTNQERDLPNAFKRRCLVHELALPSDPAALHAFLVARGRAHFEGRCGEKILVDAATLIASDRGDPRKDWRERGVAPTGLAEYLDLVRILVKRDQTDEARLARLKQVAQFVIKHREPAR